MNKNNKKLAVCVFIVRVVCLVTPFLLVVKSLNPLSIILAMTVGTVLFGYIGLQTDHLFWKRQKLIENDKLTLKLFRVLIIATFLIDVITACFCIKGNNNYDRAYLDNINSRIEHKEFSEGSDKYAEFFKLSKLVSIDCYSAQTIMDLVGEDALVYKDVTNGNENMYIELPNYTASNPAIIDMIYMHYGIAEDGVTEERVASEVNRILDMYSKIFLRSGIACATVMMTSFLVIEYLIIVLFLKTAIRRNVKYLEEEKENERSKRKANEGNVDLSNSDIGDGDCTRGIEDPEV